MTTYCEAWPCEPYSHNGDVSERRPSIGANVHPGAETYLHRSDLVETKRIKGVDNKIAHPATEKGCGKVQLCVGGLG